MYLRNLHKVEKITFLPLKPTLKEKEDFEDGKAFEGVANHLLYARHNDRRGRRRRRRRKTRYDYR